MSPGVLAALKKTRRGLASCTLDGGVIYGTWPYNGDALRERRAIQWWERLPWELPDEDDEECQGHPAGPFDWMGVTAYCDGSCRR